MVMKLRVNGEDVNVSCTPDTPLLYAIRNDLGLVGSRYGCGAGYCGACTVLVDGEPTASCDVPVEAVVDQDIVTIEGLSAGGAMHPVQKKFLELQAAQCGYCITGIIVTAVALIDSMGQPTRAQVDEALEANLCRCGAHTRIVDAILQTCDERVDE